MDIFVEITKMIFVFIKKCVVDIYNFGIIITKFYYLKKLYLVILFKVEKNLEKVPYYTIKLYHSPFQSIKIGKLIIKSMNKYFPWC